MESRYKMVKLLVDNPFQGQHGKLWAQEKKDKQQLSLQFRITSFYLTVINPFTPKSARSKFEKTSLNFNEQNQQNKE